MDEKLAKERLKEVVVQGGPIPDDLRVALADAVGADEDEVRDQLGGGSTAGSLPPFSGGRPVDDEHARADVKKALKNYDKVVEKRRAAAIENDKSFSTVGVATWDQVYGDTDSPDASDGGKGTEEGPIYPKDDSTNVPTSQTGGRSKAASSKK